MNGGQVTLFRFALGLAFGGRRSSSRAPGRSGPRRKGLLVARGFFGGVAALLYFLAIERIPAGEATLLNNTFPIWAVLLSLFLLTSGPTVHLAIGARASRARACSSCSAAGGVSFGLGIGEILGIVSAHLRRRRGDLDPGAPRDRQRADHLLRVRGRRARSCRCRTRSRPGPRRPSPGPPRSASGWSAFLAQLFMTEAYGALSVPEAALWQQLTPIASYLWALALGERIGWTTLVGVLLGVAGIVYGSVLGHRPRVARSPRGAARGRASRAEEP